MKQKIFLCFAVATLFSSSALANGTGILDVEKIIKDSSAMRDIQSKISKKQDDYQQEVNKKQNKAINLVFDKELSYKKMQKIMHTSALAGYTEFKFIVQGNY